jgi:hypothetical protein
LEFEDFTTEERRGGGVQIKISIAHCVMDTKAFGLHVNIVQYLQRKLKCETDHHNNLFHVFKYLMLEDSICYYVCFFGGFFFGGGFYMFSRGILYVQGGRLYMSGGGDCICQGALWLPLLKIIKLIATSEHCIHCNFVPNTNPKYHHNQVQPTKFRRKYKSLKYRHIRI